MLFYEKVKKSRAARRDSKHATRVTTGDDNTRSFVHEPGARSRTGRSSNTNIQNCIQEELSRYFELLDGQVPSDLYRMVMSQVEHTLIAYVLEECGNNQSRAAEYLGISRGTLRNKLTEQGLL